MSLASEMLAAFGPEAQSAQMGEEAAQFAHAALRVSRQLRARRVLGIDAQPDEHLLERLAEETADLELQLEQARLLVGTERMGPAREKTIQRARGILRTAPTRASSPKPSTCALLMWSHLSPAMKLAMMDAAAAGPRQPRRVTASRPTESALRARGMTGDDRYLTPEGAEVREAARLAGWPGLH